MNSLGSDKSNHSRQRTVSLKQRHGESIKSTVTYDTVATAKYSF